MRNYVCLRKVKVRSGRGLRSRAVDVLPSGHVMWVDQAVGTPGGMRRLHCGLGWVSERDRATGELCCALTPEEHERDAAVQPWAPAV